MERTPCAAARSAAAAIVCASATVLASGFSHSTCLPAASAAMAISACVSPGVHTSTSCTSSDATTSRQSVDTLAQPYFAAAAFVLARSRPPSTASCGTIGRSKNRCAVRQAWECTAPMNAWPTMPTPSRPPPPLAALPSVITHPPCPCGLSTRTPLRCPARSGGEPDVQVRVGVLLGHHGGVGRDERGDLVLGEVGDALVLTEQPGERDRRGRHGGAVEDGRLDDRVVGLDAVHHVLGACAADHDELAAARRVDRGHHADALVVVVVPQGVQLGRTLQQVRRLLLAGLGGELGGHP